MNTAESVKANPKVQRKAGSEHQVIESRENLQTTMRQGQSCPPGQMMMMMMVNPISGIYTCGSELDEDRRKPPSSLSDRIPTSNSTTPAA
jgi:hypothetical protein